MQTLMEPINPLHTALQALGDIPIHMEDTRQTHGRSSQTHTSDAPGEITPTSIKLSHNDHMFVCKYTHLCTDSHTYKTHTTGRSDSHKHTTGARQTPPTFGHMQALLMEETGLTMPPWPELETQKRLHLHPREGKTGTPKKNFFQPYPHHHNLPIHLPPQPSPPPDL